MDDAMHFDRKQMKYIQFDVKIIAPAGFWPRWPKPEEAP